MAAQHFSYDAKLPEVVIQHKDARPIHTKVPGNSFRVQGGFPVGRRKGEQDDEFAALPFPAFHTDGAAHPGDQPGADGKAETETGYATCVLQPLESGEYPLRVLFVHAAPRIPDTQTQLAPPVLRLQPDAPFLGELQGIREQVVDDLLEMALVAADHHVRAGETEREAQALPLRKRGVIVHCLLEQGFQVEDTLV